MNDDNAALPPQVQAHVLGFIRGRVSLGDTQPLRATRQAFPRLTQQQAEVLVSMVARPRTLQA